MWGEWLKVGASWSENLGELGVEVGRVGRISGASWLGRAGFGANWL